MMRSIDWTSNPPSRFARPEKGRELGDFAARRDPRGWMDPPHPAEDLLCCVRCWCAIRWRYPGRECRRGRRSGSGSHNKWRGQVSRRRRRARNCEIGFFPVRIGVVRLFRDAGRDRAPGSRPQGLREERRRPKSLDLCGKIISRKSEGQRNGFALGGGDSVDVILELVGNPVGLFVGGAQGMPTRGRLAVLSWGLAGVMEHQIVASGREGAYQSYSQSRSSITRHCPARGLRLPARMLRFGVP